MRCLGIIGGIAPESTVDYYRLIIARHRQVTNGHYPAIIINSIDLHTVVGYISAGENDRLVDYLLDEIAKLARAGADFALLSSNAAHIVFDELRGRSPLPLISIVEATARVASARGLKRLGLLATRFTMRGGFYTRLFERSGMTIILPNQDEQEYVHAKYVGELVTGSYTGELVNGVFLPETRKGLLEIIAAMTARDQIEAAILGGTELPLILRDEREAGIPLLDTTAIHVESAVAELLR